MADRIGELAATIRTRLEIARIYVNGDDALAALAELEGIARRQQARLADIRTTCERRRIGIHMDGTSQFGNPTMAEIHALAAPVSAPESGTA